MSLYFDELPVGFRFTTASRTISRDEIVGFARDWDPQDFHLDETAASMTHFGGLIASGWHTLLVAFNLSMQAGIWDEASMGASGMDEIRWLKPVFPGDSLHVEAEVIEATRSASRPDRGRVRIRADVMNQFGDKVASMIGNHLIKVRLPG